MTYSRSRACFDIQLQASGGVKGIEDLEGLATDGVIIGRAIYEGALDLRAAMARGQNMLTKRIIACLDVCDGRVVKGVQFRNHRDMGDMNCHSAMRMKVSMSLSSTTSPPAATGALSTRWVNRSRGGSTSRSASRVASGLLMTRGPS